MNLPFPRNCTLTVFGTLTGWTCAVVIPAKDEADRIAACLNASAVACRNAADQMTGIVVVINNTTDGSVDVVTTWAGAHTDIPVLVADCQFDRADAGVGSARRLGLDLALRMVGTEGVLLTTDADTIVRPDWITQNLMELDRADLICGTVLGQPEEARALPQTIAAHGSAEWDYVNACIALAAALDPQPHDPAPAHHNAAGASLALRAAVYAGVGGLPVIQMGEDRALADRIEAHDFRVRYSDLAVVETSCRMEGRTDGGMAGALRARAFEGDPFADEWLELAAAFAKRYRLRGAIRASWPDEATLRRVLTALLDKNAADSLLRDPRPVQCGTLIASAEMALPRIRLRLSDCRRELPALQAELAKCRYETPMQGTPDGPQITALIAAAE